MILEVQAVFYDTLRIEGIFFSTDPFCRKFSV